jgi:transcriptional regulator of heat shock response
MDTRTNHGSQRGIDPPAPCDDVVLTQAANYINTELSGLPLHEARTAIIERLRQERALYDALMARTLRLAQAGLNDLAPEETLHVQGTSYLLDELLGEGTDHEQAIETLRALFRMIERSTADGAPHRVH